MKYFSGERRGSESGIVAVATIVSKPVVRADDDWAVPFWIKGDPSEKRLRVELEISRRCLRPKQVIKRKWFKDDPILSHLMILKVANATNYRISANEAQRLALLTRNTGRDWNRDECVAALWAFSETEGREVSKRPSSPVARVAVTIGRAVGGVYNKVMNFRAVDPRDKRVGLPATNELDHEVWNQFYDAKSQTLRKTDLEKEYERTWGNRRWSFAITKTHLEQLGEAPDDDVIALQQFARRVRKGQPKFRKKLLKLYDSQCAISGWAPADVLDAAHISEHSKSGINHSENGILIRSDLHALMDANLLRIDPMTQTVVMDVALKKTPYWDYNGAKLRDRGDGSQVSKKYLSERFSAPLPG
jgi:hypothetical protein